MNINEVLLVLFEDEDVRAIAQVRKLAKGLSFQVKVCGSSLLLVSPKLNVTLNGVTSDIDEGDYSFVVNGGKLIEFDRIV